MRSQYGNLTVDGRLLWVLDVYYFNITLEQFYNKSPVKYESNKKDL